MKRNFLMGFVVAIMSWANIAHADFTFHSGFSNACDSITGYWSGTGKASNWLIGDCVYHGSGSLSALDASGHFTVDLTAEKDSGSILCPKQASKQLSGVCVNGDVTIMTEYGKMTGNFSTNSGDAKGTLTVSPGIDVDVFIQFLRVK